MEAVADNRILQIEAEPRTIFRRTVEEWFGWMDQVLDIHRSNFVFRQANATQLEEHERLLAKSIRTSLVINSLVAAPDFYDRDLTARLQIRIRQLQDAYDTFHDASLSDEQAEKILKEVFPE